MTEPTEAELAALDQALDALARRRNIVGDPALDALAGFAAAVDTQAEMLTRPRSEIARHIPVGRPSFLSGPTRPPGRPSSRRRLATLPVALALAFFIGVPLSTFPDEPVHPIHRMIFQDGTLSAAENARLSLVSATQALDQADLQLARAHLAHARKQLAMVTDAAARAQLDAALSNLEQRASKLDSAPGGRDAGDGHGPAGQGGTPERGQTGPSAPGSGPEPWHSR